MQHVGNPVVCHAKVFLLWVIITQALFSDYHGAGFFRVKAVMSLHRGGSSSHIIDWTGGCFLLKLGGFESLLLDSTSEVRRHGLARVRHRHIVLCKQG